MAHNPVTLRYVMRFTLTLVGAVIGAAIFIAAAVAPARAQAFADAKKALIDYSRADLEPSKACDAMSEFKSKEDCADHSHPGSGYRHGACELSCHGSAPA